MMVFPQDILLSITSILVLFPPDKCYNITSIILMLFFFAFRYDQGRQDGVVSDVEDVWR